VYRDPIVVTCQFEVPTARRDEDAAGIQWHSVSRLDDFQSAKTVEPFGQRARELLRHMLNNDHRDGQISGQLRQ
jgi:hypothetical protein